MKNLNLNSTEIRHAIIKANIEGELFCIRSALKTAALDRHLIVIRNDSIKKKLIEALDLLDAARIELRETDNETLFAYEKEEAIAG